MKTPSVKRKYWLIFFILFCITGIVLYVISVIENLAKPDHFLVWKSLVWIVLFTVFGIDKYMNYRKEVQNNQQVNL